MQKTFRLLKQLIFLFCWVIGTPILLYAQKVDSLAMSKDSLQKNIVIAADSQHITTLQSLLQKNTFLNSSGKPLSIVVKSRKAMSNDAVFYLLAGLVLLMGLIKFFFARYFTNLFRVFFNSSLRQNQLTDQLLQDKLPSLFFNIFFIISGGIYVYFLLAQYQLIHEQYKWGVMVACIGVLGVIYVVKFSTLKFTGWVTGYTEATDTYIFVIFLISKIIGMILIPFTILIAFSDLSIAATSALVSLLIIAFLLLLRFFKSYGLLQNQLKITKLHFILYVLGVEVMPLLLIYKGLLILLSKNL